MSKKPTVSIEKELIAPKLRHHGKAIFAWEMIETTFKGRFFFLYLPQVSGDALTANPAK